MSAHPSVKEAKIKPGTLYIVPTPIGNLSDMTERGIRTLVEADYIAAEDTRHSKPLLLQFGAKARLMALHEHNEKQKAEAIVDLLLGGNDVALISDAGTPLISDPGYIIVRRCRQQQLPVMALPGACAITTALSGAGVATDRFSFEGFLASKPQQRRKQLAALAEEPRTMVFYETPHRILHTLEDVRQTLGDDRELVLARELTKQYETYLYGNASELLQQLVDDPNQQRGEMVLIITGYVTPPSNSDEPGQSAQQALALLVTELPLKKAAAMVAQLYDERKNALYQWGLKNLNN